MKELTGLTNAILTLKTKDELDRLLVDLCTPSELKALKERWKVCQLLETGELSYREIHEITSASLTTIGRVARFLKDEPNNGYRNLLKKIT
ncbi:YerC/YecD family TrpR-related protein [Rickettsiaceae bacterium]|nr:YerC/YecD family TrpR-related protein [Rickettsiaceae bacterium]